MSSILSIRLVVYVGAGYLMLVALMAAFQSSLVHQPGVPGRALVASPEDIGLSYENVSLTTEDGVRLHGWFVPARDATGTVLFFHGNAGNISHRLESLEIFHDLGVNTLIIDYRGYGESEGSPSEEGLYKDARAAYRHLVDDRQVPPGKIISFGRSLGAAVAAYTASEHPVAGLVVESGFISVPELGAEIYPFLPVRTLSRLQYNTRDFIRATDVPKLVIHSEDDEIIPYHHGQALYEAADHARMVTIQGSHNAGFIQSRKTYVQAMGAFFRETLTGD